MDRRRRVHFNAAMLEVHSRLHTLGQQAKSHVDASQPPNSKHRRQALLAARRRRRHGLSSAEKGSINPNHISTMQNSAILAQVACELVGGRDTGPRLSAGPAIVCFDEFQVTDAFTAVALKAVCEILLEEGVVIVATANRHPQSLNTDGSIKSDVFQPFARKLEEWCAPVEIAAGVDYRRRAAREALANPARLQRTYFYPLDEQSTAAMENHFRELTGADTSETEPTTLEVLFGRQLEVRRSKQGAAIFTFEELCDRPLGAADYIALAQAFHTVYVADVPEMSRYTMNQARRFITLVDELYNNRCVMVCTAAVSEDHLFADIKGSAPLIDLESLQFETEAEGSRLRRDLTADGTVAPVAGNAKDLREVRAQLSGEDEEFSFRRAISRLLEMQTPNYRRRRTSNIKIEFPAAPPIATVVA